MITSIALISNLILLGLIAYFLYSLNKRGLHFKQNIDFKHEYPLGKGFIRVLKELSESLYQCKAELYYLTTQIHASSEIKIPRDPYNRETAEKAIKDFTPEAFKIYMELQCIGEDKSRWISDEILYNETLIKKYRELGFGYSIQVRQHYIDVIRVVEEEFK